MAYADWLAAHLEEWTVTTRGDLVEGFPRHYIRINPTDPVRRTRTPTRTRPCSSSPTAAASIPRGMWLGGDFLHLVRFGIRGADDPIVRDSIEVIDRVIKRDLPAGPAGGATITMAMGKKMTAARSTGRAWAVAGRF